MIGIFYKLSNFYLNKSSIDTYLMLGMYVGHSKTTVFSVKNDNSQNTETNNPVNLIKPNGIFILPQIKIGIIPKFKLN